MRIRLVTSGELPDLWWALRVLIELAQYLRYMYSIFLDLAPTLVNWSDILEYVREFRRIEAKVCATLSS